jgi:hypothetical protein
VSGLESARLCLCLCLLKSGAGVTKQTAEKRKKAMRLPKNALPRAGKQKQADSQTGKGMKQGALDIVRHKKRSGNSSAPKFLVGHRGLEPQTN